jgi:C-terminal processing protease CtpA/Prc
MKTIIVILAIIVPLSMHGDDDTVGYLGVSVQDLSEAMSIALGFDHGVLVERVESGSPADLSGITIGDLITEIDTTQLDDPKTLNRIVKENPNGRIKLTLYRKGKKVSEMITLGTKDKSRISIDIDIPEIPDLKVILGTERLEESLAELRSEIEELKEELKQIKKKLK